MNNKDFWKKGTTLGIFFAILFIVCFAWFFIRGGTEAVWDLHSKMMAMSFFGWRGPDLGSFIQSFVWGYIGLLLWTVAVRISRK